MSVKFNGIYINTGQIRARAGGGGNIAPLRVLANPSLLPQDINRFGWGTPGEDYVTVAIGRDFGDVTPLRGVLHGGGHGHTLDVGVTVEPV